MNSVQFGSLITSIYTDGGNWLTRKFTTVEDRAKMLADGYLSEDGETPNLFYDLDLKGAQGPRADGKMELYMVDNDKLIPLNTDVYVSIANLENPEPVITSDQSIGMNKTASAEFRNDLKQIAKDMLTEMRRLKK